MRQDLQQRCLRRLEALDQAESLTELNVPGFTFHGLQGVPKRYSMMNSRPLGKRTSEIEVTNVSIHGVWLLAGNKEFFMSSEDFPWFKDAPVGKILNVEQPTQVISIGQNWMLI